jgi:hypothetical protein
MVERRLPGVLQKAGDVKREYPGFTDRKPFSETGEDVHCCLTHSLGFAASVLFKNQLVLPRQVRVPERLADTRENGYFLSLIGLQIGALFANMGSVTLSGELLVRQDLAAHVAVMAAVAFFPGHTNHPYSSHGKSVCRSTMSYSMYGHELLQ